MSVDSQNQVAEQQSEEDVEEKVEKNDSRIGENSSRIALILNELDDLKKENERLRGENQQKEEEFDTLRRDYRRLARRLTAVEEEVGIDHETAGAHAKGMETSPLYLLETVGPEAVAAKPSKKLYRSRVLVENRDRWGEVRTNSKFGRHRLLATKEHDLKQRLEDARDEKLQWGQVYPAMEEIARLGGDHVRFIEEYESAKRDYGKAVVWTEVEE